MMDVFDVFASFSLLDFISGPLGKIRSGMGETEAAGGRLSSSMGSLTKSMMPFVVAAGLVLGALAATVMSTVQTQKALGELGSVGITDFNAMTKSATDFSNSFSGTTKSEFLYAAYDIKSGISSLSDKGVAEFTTLAALTAKATKSTVGQMTDLFATGYGIYKDAYKGMSDIQFGKMFSAGIAASVQAFKTDGAKMAQAISTLGAQATNANVPLEEQLSILGTLQKTMPGAEAGTKYKSFLTGAAGAGEKLGLSFLGANGQLLSTPEILEKLRSKFGTTMSAIEKLKIKKAFGSDEAVAFIDLLYSKTGELTSGMEAVTGAMGQGEQFTSKMAQHMNQDLGASLTLASQQFHNLSEIIGNIFAPTINTLVRVFSSLIIWMQELASNPIGRFFIAFAAAIAIVVIAVGVFSAAMWAATVAAGALNLAILANPIVLVGAALVAAAVLIMTYWDDIKQFFIGLWKPVQSFVDKVEAAYHLFMGIWQMDGIRAAFSNLWGSFSSGFKDAIGGVTSLIIAMAAIFLGPIALVGAAIAGLISGVVIYWDDIQNGISCLWKPVQSFIDFLSNIDLSECGRKLWSTFTDGLKSMISAPVEMVKSGLQSIRNMLPFSDAKEGPLSTLTLSGQRMMETLAGGVGSGAGSLVDAVSGALSMPGETFKSGLKDLFEAPAKYLDKGLDFAGELLFGPPPEPALAGGDPAQEVSLNTSKPTDNTSNPERSASKSGGITINNLTLNLPNVSDAEGFTRELQKLVERYDG